MEENKSYQDSRIPLISFEARLRTISSRIIYFTEYSGSIDGDKSYLLRDILYILHDIMKYPNILYITHRELLVFTKNKLFLFSKDIDLNKDCRPLSTLCLLMMYKLDTKKIQ